MTLFYLLLGLMATGFIAIAWIMANEKKTESPAPPKKQNDKPQLSPDELLGRLGLEKTTETKIQAKILPLPEFFKKTPAKELEASHLIKDPLVVIPQTTSPSSSMTKPGTQNESDLSLKYDVLSTQHKELQEKFSKLEGLFSEKSSMLEKSEKTLTNEVRNQKEFNKLKDVLEKELKETKDKAKSLAGELSNAQTDSQTHLKRIVQLEEKVKRLEVEILSSEAAINDAQAETQLARKRVLEIEEKLRSNENLILDKNQKIEDLVKRLNIHPATNDLPAPLPKPATESESSEQFKILLMPGSPEQPLSLSTLPKDPPAPSETKPEKQDSSAASESSDQDSQPPSLNQNVVDDNKEKNSPLIAPPEIPMAGETDSENNAKPEKQQLNQETLSLPPDIFANPKKNGPPLQDQKPINDNTETIKEKTDEKQI